MPQGVGSILYCQEAPTIHRYCWVLPSSSYWSSHSKDGMKSRMDTIHYLLFTLPVSPNLKPGRRASQPKHLQHYEFPFTLQSTCPSPANTFTSDPGTVQLYLSSHFLCMPTPQVSDHLQSRRTAQLLWPEWTSKLVCYPVGWNYTFFNKIWTLTLERGTLPSLSFLGYSPSALEYYIWFSYNHPFVGA